MFKSIFFSLLFSTATIFGSENGCDQEWQPIDTSHWITSSANFGFTDLSDPEQYYEEHVQFLMPHEPKFENVDGRNFIYTSDENITYTLTAQPIPSGDFNLKDKVSFMVELLSKSETNKHIGLAYFPDNDNICFIHWVRNDALIWIKLIQSEHLIYLLETTIHNPMYRDFDLVLKTSESRVIFYQDSQKMNAFANSLVIEPYLKR